MADRPLLVLGEIEEEHRAILSTDCLKAGFAPEWFESSEAATAKLTSKPYDVLLFHLLTPGAAAVAINTRTKLTRGRFPVIALADELDGDAFTRAFRAGADDVIGLGHEGAVAARLTDLPRPSRIPPGKARGEALVADPDRIRGQLLERILTDAGYRVEVVKDELATKLNLGRPGIRLVVMDESIGDIASLHASARSRSRAIWILRTKPDEAAHLASKIQPTQPVAITSKFGPPDDVLFEANRLTAAQSGESRADPRLLHGTVVSFREPGAPGTTHGYSYNISTAGIYVRSMVLPKSDQVSLEVIPPGTEEPINLSGTVAWRRGFGPTAREQSPPGFGVQLTSGNLMKWADCYRKAYAQFTGTQPEETPPPASVRPLRKPSAPRMRAVTASKSDPKAAPAIKSSPKAAPPPKKSDPKVAAAIKSSPKAAPPPKRSDPKVAAATEKSSPRVAPPPKKSDPKVAAAKTSDRKVPPPRHAAQGAAKKISMKTMVGGMMAPPRPEPSPTPPAADASGEPTSKVEDLLRDSLTSVTSESETKGKRPLDLDGGFDITDPNAGRIVESDAPPPPDEGGAPPAPSLEPPTIPKDLSNLGKGARPASAHDPSAPFASTMLASTGSVPTARGLQPVEGPSATPPGPPTTPPQSLEAEPIAPAEGAAPAETPGPPAPEDMLLEAERGLANTEPAPPATPAKKSRAGTLIGVLAILGGIAAGAVLALQQSTSTKSSAEVTGPTPSAAPMATTHAEPGTAASSAPIESSEPAPSAEPPREASSAAAPTEPEATPPPEPEPAPPPEPEPAPPPEPTPAPTPEPAPPPAAGDIPPTMAHLYVESSLDTNVFVHGKLVGRTNAVNLTHCGTRFIRLGATAGQWQSDGVVFKIQCGEENRMKLK